MKRRLWIIALLGFACRGEACEVPSAPDARPLGSRGDPCITLWDCNPGLTCAAGECRRAPDDPYLDCYYDWQCNYDEICQSNICTSTAPDAGWPWPDAAWPDAQVSDAGTGDAMPTDAGGADAADATVPPPAPAGGG